MDGTVVQRGANFVTPEQRLHLRSKQELARQLDIVERFDSHSIASNKQLAFTLVEDHHRKHSREALDTFGTHLFVEMENCLGIRLCPKPVSFRLELRPQFP